MTNDLKKQLELTRFDRAVEIVESMAQRRVLLTTMELSRLNNVLTGKDETDPWRKEPVTLTLPSGKTETFAVMADPKLLAREMLHRTTETSEMGSDVIDAAIDLYTGLVLAHVFEDANRRTAVLAAHYFLVRYGAPVSGTALHELGLGDLREDGQIQALKDTVRQMAKFAQKKNAARKPKTE